MKVYLDNCCYNRPFDDQSQVKVLIETLSKLTIQQQMREGVIEYVWSEVLDYEVGRSRFIDRKLQIQPWAHGASAFVELNESIRESVSVRSGWVEGDGRIASCVCRGR